MLGIVPSCNLVQYQEKLMIQPQENDKNHNFKPNFGPPKFFSLVLPLLVVRQCSKLSPYANFRKTNKPNLIKMTNLILGPILTHLAHIWSSEPFLQILPLLVRDCSKLSSYAILKKKTNESNLRKWQKQPDFGSDFGLFGLKRVRWTIKRWG